MASNVIDLALSDDENEQQQAPVVAPQRSTAVMISSPVASNASSITIQIFKHNITEGKQT